MKTDKQNRHRRSARMAAAGAACAWALVGCESGLGASFEREFEAVKAGDSRAQLLATLKTQPLTAESFDIGGFSVTRIEVADVRARYSFTLAATPLSEPRLISKARTPHGKCN